MAGAIDAHHHFWKIAGQNQPWRNAAHSALEKGFGPEDIKVHLDEAGVDGTVLIQSVNEGAENDRLQEYEKTTASKSTSEAASF